MFTCSLYHLIIIGAVELDAVSQTSSTAPLFLSSLHCTEGDQSLLEDCSHDRLGLASCDDDEGLAVAKCFGEGILEYDHCNLWIN